MPKSKVVPSRGSGSENRDAELEAGQKGNAETPKLIKAKTDTLAEGNLIAKHAPGGISKTGIMLSFIVTLMGTLGILVATGFFEVANDAIVKSESSIRPVTFPFELVLGIDAPLPASSSNVLLLLKRTPVVGSGRRLDAETEDDDDELVVAKSYDGEEWESAPGIEPLEPTCSTNTTAEHTENGYSACKVNLNNTGRYTYRVSKENLNLDSLSPRTQYARMALQATFGPTRTEMSAYLAAHNGKFDAETWIQEQIALPLTSMRQRWRERSAYRSTVGAGVTSPCEVGSRWHRYAFTYRDRMKVIVVYADRTPGKYSLYVDNILRSEVDEWLGVVWTQAIADDPSFQDGSKIWAVCDVKEHVDGFLGVWAGSSCGGRVWTYAKRALFIARNPAISFANVDTTITHVFTAADVTLANVETFLNGDAIVIKSLSASCDISKRVGAYVYMSVAGVYYRFDPRVKRGKNTIADPHVPAESVSIYSNDNEAVCPSAKRNFVNADGCKRGNSCAPLIFSDTPVTLNEATLIKWYTSSGKHVHHLQGLFLTQAYEVSPCTSVKARWKRIPSGCTVTALDVTTAVELASRIRTSVDTSNPHVLDTDTVAPSISCSVAQSPGVSTIGAIIDVDGTCFQHVHPKLYDVHDFTFFAISHPGTLSAYKGNRRNPITRFAEEGNAELIYGHYSMDNFESAFKSSIYLKESEPIGRLGDTVSFRHLPAALQTFQMADLINATAAKDTSSSSAACGSPYEVANIPEYGNQYLVSDGDGTVLAAQYIEADRQMEHGTDKYGVFLTVATTAADQLRQRMGFALSQIFTIGERGFGGFGRRYVSPYAYYHDILSRHAFGNYRELLQEIAYSPLMAEYLTFLGSKSKFSSGSYPDENFARESMQLFTIGLWEMHENGEYMREEVAGKKQLIPTYDTVDVTNFARAWTGFFARAKRNTADETESNVFDPMVLDPEYRDDLPKTKLKSSGYIGDKYPLCGDLPPQHFLTKGAKYVYTGDTSTENIEDPNHSLRARIDYLGRFKPAPATSALHAKLCAAASAGAKCTFPSEVTLNVNIPCDGIECTTATIFTVQIADPNDNNKSKYYTYQPVPCVRMALFSGGIVSKHPPHAKQCSDPRQHIAGPVCCRSGITNGAYIESNIGSNRKNMCRFWGEMMTQEQAQTRCEEQGFRLCSDVYGQDPSVFSCAADLAVWRIADKTCQLQVFVGMQGQVSVVDDRADSNPNQDDKRFVKNNNNFFKVLWLNTDGTTSDDRYPTVAENNCTISSLSPLACVIVGTGCLCELTVQTAPVFTNTSLVPSLTEIRDSVFIGAPHPSSFPPGTYNRCTSSVCLEAAARGVKVHVKAADGVSLIWNEHTILEYPSPFSGDEPVLLFNKASTVFLGTSQSVSLSERYSFRNPPNFMPFVGEQTRNHLFNNKRMYYRHAELETNAVLDYLFQHNNTPAFVARKLIQRFVTSNPSPRYVKVVSDAFRTGVYRLSSKLTFSGKRGDLAASLAAVLLDREARSTALEADPSFGKMREPLLKIIHVLRSLEYTANPDTSEIMMPNLQDSIGQGPYGSPTVFGFYDVDYSPKGKVNKRKLVSPEGELGTGPYIINFLNGMSSLIDRGLTSCGYGFGDPSSLQPYDVFQKRDVCKFNHRRRSGGGKVDKNLTGKLAFAPSNSTATAKEVIDEINLLLTGGRLSEHNIALIAERFSNAAGITSKPVAAVPEFDCQCYLDRYPSMATAMLETEGPAWEPRSYCEHVFNYFRDVGLKHDPPQDGSCSNREYALKEALKLFMFTQEFHTTNLNSPNKKVKKAKPLKERTARAYKAVVVINLIGGADTFSMLVPHSNCGDGRDHYQEYSDARGGVYDGGSDTGGAALAKSTLRQISVPAGTQPCAIFGVHEKMPVLKTLYDAGDLAFLANTGTLIEHLTVSEMRTKKKRVPPSIGDHKGSQKCSQNLDCENAAAAGVLGRLFNELSNKKEEPYQADLFSVYGNMKILEGSSTPSMMDDSSDSGVPRFAQYNRYRKELGSITSQRSDSIYAETAADAVSAAIDQTEELGSLMGNITLSTTFASDAISRQLKQVAKVIKLRQQLNQERGGFIIGSGGWDTHGQFDETVGPLFETINDALDSFQQEMKAQGTWDDVAVLLISDFGRTITSNGKGTDHGWGGNYFITGGAVRGSKILKFWGSIQTN